MDNTLKTQGQCNAYQAAAKSEDEAYSRLEDIPEEMRDGAKRHVQTVWAIKKFHENNRRK